MNEAANIFLALSGLNVPKIMFPSVVFMAIKAIVACHLWAMAWALEVQTPMYMEPVGTGGTFFSWSIGFTFLCFPRKCIITQIFKISILN
jgi:hypothetical protein